MNKKSKLDRLFLIGIIIFSVIVIYFCLANLNHHKCSLRICRKGYDCVEQVNLNSPICKSPLFDYSVTAEIIRLGIAILIVIDAIINIILVVGYLKKEAYKRIIISIIMLVPTLFFSIIMMLGYLGLLY